MKMNNLFNFETYTGMDSMRDGYPQFEESIKDRFNSIVNAETKLFTTNANGIYDAYLSNLPVHAQQHYKCNACKDFFERYGSLVTITEDGEMKSVLWDETIVPTFFIKSVKAVRRLVLHSHVTGVFLPDTTTLGHPKTGEWTHPHVKIPGSMVYRSRVFSAEQVMAQKREEFGMVNRAIREFLMDTVEKALSLVNSEALYRGDSKVKPTLEWFKSLLEKIADAKSLKERTNIIWLAVATAPTGFAHVRNTTAGSLMKDIQDGLSTRFIINRFESKMSTYMRSQSDPSDRSILEAERMVAELGIGNSLYRRYASIEEIPAFMWKPKAVEKVELKQPNGKVFGHLLNKNKTAETMSLPTSVMTFAKFYKTILPTADSMEVLVDNPAKFMAMVTAVDETSENILQWDNPFSWYYHGGIDSEMKRRVEEAGGRYENNEIRVSLMWEGLTDLDLHCITPNGEEIYYRNKRGLCGGYLDLDMNGLDKKSNTPVENMRWASNAPQGSYKFYVRNFNEREKFYGTSFKVELEVNGQVYRYEGKPLEEGDQITVFEFVYVKGQQPSLLRSNCIQSTSNEVRQVDGLVKDWNVRMNSFVKVNGVTTSPNLWGNNPVTHAGTHVFFLLDDVKDLSQGKGRGFFNEMLKSDLRPIRKTLELFTADTPTEDARQATACGVGYSKDQEWNLTVKVTSGNTSRVIKIDRWD